MSSRYSAAYPMAWHDYNCSHDESTYEMLVDSKCLGDSAIEDWEEIFIFDQV